MELDGSTEDIGIAIANTISELILDILSIDDDKELLIKARDIAQFTAHVLSNIIEDLEKKGT